MSPLADTHTDKFSSNKKRFFFKYKEVYFPAVLPQGNPLMCHMETP